MELLANAFVCMQDSTLSSSSLPGVGILGRDSPFKCRIPKRLNFITYTEVCIEIPMPCLYLNLTSNRIESVYKGSDPKFMRCDLTLYNSYSVGRVYRDSNSKFVS